MIADPDLDLDPIAVLEVIALAQVAAVANDPRARYALRVSFYEKFGFGVPGTCFAAGYGDSELAFLQWEIRRGVLNPITDGPGSGSPWWRAVNGAFLYYAQLARLVWEAQIPNPQVSNEVQYWLDYIARPSPESWYCAHNASIIAGYLDPPTRDLARAEIPGEQLFMNEVLYRLLYAESLAIGWAMGEIGQIAADPRLFAVWLITQMTAVYPCNYPLTAADIANVEHLGTTPEAWIADFMDEGLILPHITELYALVAGIVRAPELERAIKNGVPIYPDLAPEAKAKLLAIRAQMLTTGETT